jgi:serine/threonine-protein kinase HipA
VPAIEVDPANLYLFGQQMVGKVTLSGVQSKVALGWSQKTLKVAADEAGFILKPQGVAFPGVPENEHISLLIARAANLEVAPTTLVRLRDDSLGLLSRRFDRSRGRRIPMEDFCQLAELLPREKYSGSAELCARIVRRYSSVPGVDLQRLFRQTLVSWWIGNGDLHLKNLALLTTEMGQPRLSPAFDLVSTGVVIPGDPLALPVSGKKSRLKRSDWHAYARYCELPDKLAAQEIDSLIRLLPTALDLVARSFLPPTLQEKLAGIVVRNTAVLRNEPSQAA